jgi:dsDNA-specific endonuclease/ATPase MutS2
MVKFNIAKIFGFTLLFTSNIVNAQTNNQSGDDYMKKLHQQSEQKSSAQGSNQQGQQGQQGGQASQSDVNNQQNTTQQKNQTTGKQSSEQTAAKANQQASSQDQQSNESTEQANITAKGKFTGTLDCTCTGQLKSGNTQDKPKKIKKK